ncbi:MAG: GDSL-type esterase/lipase family protein [Myxococcota bacterium]|nr:GDSL-type esterase/lipase family protein [Myxococcota bacterium]
MSKQTCVVWLGDFGHHTLHPYWDIGFEQLNTGYQPVNLCVAGETIGRLVRRLDDGLLGDLEPVSMIINIGINDIVDTSATDVALHIQALAQRLAAEYPRAQIGLHSLVPRSGRTPWTMRRDMERVNGILRTQPLPDTCRLIDIYDIFVGAKRRLRGADHLTTMHDWSLVSLDSPLDASYPHATLDDSLDDSLG